MPPRSRVAHARHLVTAVLVSHDGARWLPTTLEAIQAQTRAPQRLIGVDTGSTDDSPLLLEKALGADAVVRCRRNTGFGAAVQAGLDSAGEARETTPAGGGTTPDRVEWVWLLHDDCAPEPGALQALLDLAVESPSSAVIGPKCLTWDGQHLSEIGITTDVTGRRETGLERREVDHGQHDSVTDVLAVGSAGALVRRDLWDRLGGYDGRLALCRDDLDFGWRVNLSGARVVLAPQAVVRHANAMSNGLRRPDVGGGTYRRLDRRHALRALATNLPLPAATFALPRLLLGTLLRSLGLFLFRRPAAAYDELAAFLGVLLRPDDVLRARARRRPLRTRPSREVRQLLAGPGVRMRHRGEWVAELLAGQRPDLQEGRFRRRRAGVETGPVAEEAENLEVSGTGWVRRLVRRPWFLLLVALTVVALVAERRLLGGALTGGRLLPAPAGARDLWAIYVASWHPVGLGSETVAPPYLAALAALSTLLLGKAWLAVDVLVLGAVPLAGLTAFRAARLLTSSVMLRAWAAVTYALVPVVTGAVAGGRIDVLGAAVLLPLAAASLARLVRDDPRVAGWHRPASTGLLLAATAAFAPITYVALGGAALIACLVVVARRPLSVVATAVALALPPLLLLPWTAQVVRTPRLLVVGAGLPETLSRARPVPAHELLLLHPGGPAQPWVFFAVPLLLAALAGFLRRDRPGAAAFAGLVATAGVGLAVLASRTTVVAGRPDVRGWAGAAVLVAAAGFLAAALLAADRARERLARHAFGWRQPAAALLAVLAVAVPVFAAAGWLVRGADLPLRSASVQAAPAFVLAEVATGQHPRALVLRETPSGVHYSLMRATGGPHLGDADVSADAAPTARLDSAVRQLAGGGGTDVPATLAAYGVRMIVVADPSKALATTLDRTAGLTRGQSSGAAVWRVQAPAGRLTLLPPVLARQALAGTVPSSTARDSVRVLSSGEEGADTEVPAGPAGRLLVLAEPADHAWKARLDGEPLQARTAYGWAQAFVMPADGGRLVVTRDGSRRSTVLAVELALVGLAVLAAVPSVRRRDADIYDDEEEPV